MTATDELRRLLDERGVEYETDDRNGLRETIWCGVAAFQLSPTAKMTMIVTPEQAIAATLGGGECELHECEGSFSALNRPVWRCDCGTFMTQYTDATTYHKPRFCPNCGRKAVKR